MSKSPKTKPHHFHPLEISILGFSGTGKTTLITRLISHLKASWKLAYIKHDAHRFEVDTPGKDSFRATEAGASSSFIGNAEHFAWMASGTQSYFSQRSIFLDYDAAIIEGHKTLDVDKIVMLDEDHAILDHLPVAALGRIRAFVGEGATPSQTLPWDVPYFQRDSIEAIALCVETIWQLKMNLSARPLHALVLGGGRSTRMGRDKSRIEYKGQLQALRVLDLFKDLGLPAYLSLRQDQWSAAERADLPILDDQFQNLGPIGGILTAMQRFPDAAWLVTACDLPLLDRAVLDHLLSNRRPEKLATAYLSEHDGLPEPLCAIYEPIARMRLLEALGLGLSCPRKVLINSNTQLLAPFKAAALTNVNTPEEYEHIQTQFSEMTL